MKERYEKRNMRDMKRYGWNMKERSFTTDDIERDSFVVKKRRTGYNNSLLYKGVISN